MESDPKPNANELAIEAEGLVRRFGSVEALAKVSLQVKKGEFFSLLGPSGCGKTTLLRIIAGLDTPDGGSLKIGGVDTSAMPAHHRPVNTVFQSYALFPHMTVWDNIAFGLRMKRVPVPELRARVKGIMEMVEVSELAARRPDQLSGGQKQRVALARAVVNEPAVLLLDEPLGALDLKLRKQLQVELHQLQRRLRMTFIYVTHDQEEALVMSDRIAVMNSGRLEQIDTGERLYERPRTRFVAQFIGSCTLLRGTVLQNGRGWIKVQSTVGTVVATLPEGGRALELGSQITLALRPEKIRLSPAGNNCGEGNVVEAMVEDVAYSGAETTYELRAADQAVSETPDPHCESEVRLRAVGLNARVGHQGFNVGDNVWCQFGHDAVIILED